MTKATFDGAVLRGILSPLRGIRHEPADDRRSDWLHRSRGARCDVSAAERVALARRLFLATC